MPNSRFYSSTAAVTSLQVTANSGDSSIQVASSSGWPGSFPFTVSLDYGSANEELVDVTGGGPNIFTVTRAVDGTSATTHNAGAVVRHVSSARDFTDSRSHEAATTNVHGITGSFVDTLSTQTMSNKTLNSPTINNGTVTGTVTATGATINNGTYGNPTLTTPTVTGGLTADSEVLKKANGTDIVSTIRRNADTTGRLTTTADGAQAWGPGGSSATDTTLARTGAGVLGLTGALTTTSSVTATGSITSSGDITWTGVPWSTYSASWTASGSDPILGTGGTLAGRYKQYGKTVVLDITIITGTTGFFRGSGNYSLSLPLQAANQSASYVGNFHILGSGSNGRWLGQCIISPNATTTSGFIPEVSGGNATGKAVFWQHDTPFAVVSGDQFRFSIVYEAA